MLVVQAMIHAAWIAFDPMTNGKIIWKVMELYAKAQTIAPENLLVLAKQNLKLVQLIPNQCVLKLRKLLHFATFKPETAFSPKWVR